MKLWDCLVGLLASAAVGGIAVADHGKELTEASYADSGARLGVLILEINWGRQWNCGNYDNVQLQSLRFTSGSETSGRFDGIELDLGAPSRLLAENSFTPLAIMVQPGIYALTGFDVQLARSVQDVSHYVGTPEELLPDGKPRAGTFSIAAGEIIYIGHFGLDCGEEVIPWRYHLTNQEDFESYVSGFREVFPYAASGNVEFRLFETETMGMPFLIPEPVVPGVQTGGQQ
jgi:hypothetical protein